MNTEQTPVIYRVWRDSGGTIALFPTIPSSCDNWYEMQAYERVGQHGGADYNHVIRMTRLAKPEEYADLHRELTGIGYDLRVYKRETRQHRAIREAEYNRIARELNEHAAELAAEK